MIKLRLADLYTSRGTLNRGPYFAWGCLLMGIKYTLDRVLFEFLFGHTWHIENYFGGGPHLDGMTPGQVSFEHFVLLATSLPFLVAGVMLSLRRLRSLRLPLWLVALFVIPYLKWLLFAALSLLPSRPDELDPTPDTISRRGFFDRVLPAGKSGRAVVAVFVPALLGVVTIAWSANTTANYGWALFAGIPFLMGFIASLLFGLHQRRTLGESLGVAALACGLAGLGVLVVAIEGAICVAMAVPIAIPLALVGAVCGHAVQGTRRLNHLSGASMMALPLLVVADSWTGTEAPLLRVTSSIEIDAPRTAVWQHVVTFSELPSELEWLFRTGIAYPIRATIDGEGVGAVRYCEFSTGAFVEPITVWDEPHVLGFTVTQNPAPMQEWSFYDEIHPPHLEGFLASESGEFRLIQIADDRTRLEGTTWYRHNMAPVRYWQLWSDFIIHRIHERVLRHIKTLAEAELTLGRATANTDKTETRS